MKYKIEFADGVSEFSEEELASFLFVLEESKHPELLGILASLRKQLEERETQT